MSQYLLTDSTDVDFDTFNWQAATRYDYRRANLKGRPFVQAELDRRRQIGQPVALWRFPRLGVPPVLMERHNL